MKEKQHSVEEEAKGGCLLPIIMGLVLLAVIFGIIRLDLFGFTTNYIKPVLGDFPGSSLLMPQKKTETNGSTVSVSLSQLQTENNNLKTKIDEVTKELNLANSQLKSLQDVQIKLEQFEKEKELFAQKVAKQDSPQFKEFYQNIDPVVAKQIYTEMMKEDISADKLKKLTSIYNEMDSKKAADIFSVMYKEQPNLVISVFKSLDKGKAAEILSNMDNKIASKLSSQMVGRN